MKIMELEGVGVEILDVDLAALADNELNEIKGAFAENGLVFFRDQNITEEEHIKFAEGFGDINVNRFFTAHKNHPQIAMVSKEPEETTNIGGGWHTDHSYDQEPALGSILVARKLPETGGDTWFTSMYKAYEKISDGLKDTLDGLNAVHSARHIFGASGFSADDDYKDKFSNADMADVLADPIHPVIIRHPLSGKNALYVNPTFTLRFEGWTAEESAPLLEYLYDLARDETLVTKFQWKPGSIAFWDNRATWHFAQNDYQGDSRIMHRITVEGCKLGR
jgi:taurine dioxygenase